LTKRNTRFIKIDISGRGTGAALFQKEAGNNTATYQFYIKDFVRKNNDYHMIGLFFDQIARSQNRLQHDLERAFGSSRLYRFCSECVFLSFIEGGDSYRPQKSHILAKIEVQNGRQY
jgi:hypothetical protein